MKRLLALLGAASLAITGCASSSGAGASEDTLVLGAVTELSGNLQQYGLGAKLGFEAAAEEINSTGGITIDGTKVEITSKVVDNRSDPSAVTSAAREVLDAGAIAALGPDLSGRAAYQVWRDELIMLAVDFDLTAELQADPDKFPLMFDPLPFYGSVYESAFKQVMRVAPDVKTIAILGPNDEEGQGAAALWADTAEQLGLEVLPPVSFPNSTSDYATYLTTIKAQKPDMLLPLQSPDQATAIIRQATQLDVSRYYMNNALNPEKVLADPLMKDATIFIPNYGPQYSRAINLPGDEPSVIFGDGDLPAAPTAAIVIYYAVQMIAEAAEAADSTDPKEIAAELVGTTIDGPFGTCTMEEDHSQKCRTDLVVIQDGKVHVDSYSDPDATTLLGTYVCDPTCRKE